MATKYIDVTVTGGEVSQIQVQNTSTVTGHVRVAWDTGISRHGLAIALREIILEMQNLNSVPDNTHFTDNKNALDRIG